MTTGRHLDWNELRKEIERGLGKLCMEFSTLETSLACAIGYFVSPDISVGHTMAAETGFKAKVALFSSLFLKHTADSSASARLKKFRKHAEKAESRRNRLVHSIYWPAPSGPGAILRIKTTAKGAKGLQFEFEEITPEHIDKALRELEQVTDELNCLLLDSGHDWTGYVAKFYGAFVLR